MEKKRYGVEVAIPKKLACKKCGHAWIPRTGIVRICPRCKTHGWNVEKKVRV